MSEIIEHITSPDAQARVTIYKRADGLFEYTFDKFYVDDLPEYDHHMVYWGTVDRRGIFDSVATAKCEAAAEFDWVEP